LLSKFSLVSDILPIILYLIYRKRNSKGGIWVIFLYVLLSALTDYTYTFARSSIDPLYFYGSFTIIEYTLFSLFLYLSFKGNVLKIIVVVASLIFYGIAISNFIIKNKGGDFDSLSASAEAILIIVYSIFFLYQQVNDPSVFLVYNTKKFWIILAFLIYFSSTLFLFIYATTMTNQEHKSYWNINNFFNALKNILFSVGFVMKYERKNQFAQESSFPESS
jgi:hypothetical protein